MAELEIRTPEGLVLGLPVAGAGSRLAAGLCDGLAVGFLYLGGLLVVSLAAGVDPTGLTGAIQGALLIGLPLVLAGYHFFFHAFGGGATPGKHLLGLRVVARDGYPPTVMQHLLRSSIWPIDALLFVPVPLGLVVIACSRHRQRIGDHVAGTLVLHHGAAVASDEPYPGERWSRLRGKTLDLHPGSAALMGDADLAFLRRLLGRRGLPPEARRRLFVRTARHFAERLDLGPFEDARVFLRELYLFLREAREGATAGIGPSGTSVSRARGGATDPGSARAARAPRG